MILGALSIVGGHAIYFMQGKLVSGVQQWEETRKDNHGVHNRFG